jgi:hypothetical protein
MHYIMNFKAFLPAVLLTILLGSCAKEGPSGPTGPAGPSYTGSISGHVMLFDKYGSPVIGGYTSAKLTLASSTTTVSNSGSAAPDNSGYYIYSSVKTGSYSITATDSAYASKIINNVNFVLGNLNQDITLSAVPDSFITAFHAQNSTVGLYDSLTFHAAADARVRNAILFVNNKAAVGNLPANYLLKYIVQIPANNTSVTFMLPRQDLLNAGLVTGGKVYFAAYSYVIADKSVYEDLTTGRNVYNAVYPVPFIDSALVP